MGNPSFLGTTLNLDIAGPFMMLGELVSVLVAVLQLVIAIGLFTHTLPVRYRFPVRVVIVVGLSLVTMVMLGVTSFTIHPDADEIGNSQVAALNIPSAWQSASAYIPLTVSFSIVLAICILTVKTIYRSSMQTAIFCATAGYTIQNLESGATELVASLVRTNGMDPTTPFVYALNQAVCMILIYGGCYLLLVRRLGADGLTAMESRQMTLMFPVVCLVIIGYDAVLKSLDGYGIDLNYIIILRMFHGFACVATLWTEYKLLCETRNEQDSVIAERLFHERKRQYQVSQETIEAINIKCHDLRYQIRALTNSSVAGNRETIEDISRTVSIYDSLARTGNEALDTILTEKRLLCGHRNITLTCIADGDALCFMKPPDLYSLFGNALDNAIEASASLQPANRRSITLIVKQALGCVSIHVENFYEGTVEFDANGIPVTSKKTCSGERDTMSHGFGTRSMMAIVQRYGGTLSATADGGVYCLDMLFFIDR